MNVAGSWDKPPKARDNVIAAYQQAKAETEGLGEVMAAFDDARVGYELAKEGSDAELLAEVDETLYKLVTRMEKVERQSLLSGPHDHRNCFVTIQAGDGGAEADDWASMLDRMYLYYWERMGWKVEEMNRSPGMQGGLSQVAYLIKGPYAYGYMSCERGTHRLARVSPFN